MLAKLIEVQPLYQNIQIDLSWENVTQVSDPDLRNIFTGENHKHVEGDSDQDIEENDYAYEKGARFCFAFTNCFA